MRKAAGQVALNLLVIFVVEAAVRLIREQFAGRWPRAT